MFTIALFEKYIKLLYQQNIKQFLCYVLADNSYADMCIGLLLFWLISKIRQAYDPPHFTTVLVHLSVLHKYTT